MAEKQIFPVLLEKLKNSQATKITIPFDVEKVFGAKRVPVKARINNAEYRSTIFRMSGKYMMAIPKSFRDAAQIKAGETIIVEIERDTEKRAVEVPKDFADALKQANLQDAFSRLSYTHQKEHVNAINEAQKAETRLRRIEKAIENLAAQK